jgi:hypothetical protein
LKLNKQLLSFPWLIHLLNNPAPVPVLERYLALLYLMDDLPELDLCLIRMPLFQKTPQLCDYGLLYVMLDEPELFIALIREDLPK